MVSSIANIAIVAGIKWDLFYIKFKKNSKKKNRKKSYFSLYKIAKDEMN